MMLRMGRSDGRWVSNSGEPRPEDIACLLR